LLVGGVIVACQSATEVRLTLRTNVEHKVGINVAVWANGRIDSPGAPLLTTALAWKSDGNIGDVVITPRERNDEDLWVRVAVGVGRDAGTCSDADARGCIIAKRKLRFVPRTGLRLPVVLHLACEGVVCSADTTCNYLGRCVSAEVDPQACATAEGCGLDGDNTVTGTVPRLDAGNDTGVIDAPLDLGSVDAPTEAAATDASDSAVSDAADAASDFADGGADASDSGLGGPTVTRMVAGAHYTCMPLGTGQLKCWGENTPGKLGLGDLISRGAAPGAMGPLLPAVDLGPGRSAAVLAAGITHTCAILDSGQVKCWGENNFGKLGLGDTGIRGDVPGEMGAALPPVDLGPGRTALRLALGHFHSCAILDNGQVKCWGTNGANGELGLGDLLGRGAAPGQMGVALPAVDLGPGRTAVGIAAGVSHTCAVLDNAQLKCWGFNLNGQLGYGDTTSRGSAAIQMGAGLPPVDLGAGRTALQVAAGAYSTCARLDNGSVKCWGLNDEGQLGLGDGIQRTAPASAVADLGPGRTAASLTAAFRNTCVRLDTGTVKCWGRNFYGQLGIGDTMPRGNVGAQMGANLPSANMGAGRSIVEVAIGVDHLCARLDDDTVKCWGYGPLGALGYGDVQTRGDFPNEMGANLPVVVLQ